MIIMVMSPNLVDLATESGALKNIVYFKIHANVFNKPIRLRRAKNAEEHHMYFYYSNFTSHCGL